MKVQQCCEANREEPGFAVGWTLAIVRMVREGLSDEEMPEQELKEVRGAMREQGNGRLYQGVFRGE